MTTTATAKSVDNGVNVEALLGAREALTGAPEDALPGEDAPHHQSPATLVTAPAGGPTLLGEGLRQ